MAGGQSLPQHEFAGRTKEGALENRSLISSRHHDTFFAQLDAHNPHIPFKTTRIFFDEDETIDWSCKSSQLKLSVMPSDGISEAQKSPRLEAGTFFLNMRLSYNWPIRSDPLAYSIT
jgi:hypothetical protein